MEETKTKKLVDKITMQNVDNIIVTEGGGKTGLLPIASLVAPAANAAGVLSMTQAATPATIAELKDYLREFSLAHVDNIAAFHLSLKSGWYDNLGDDSYALIPGNRYTFTKIGHSYGASPIFVYLVATTTSSNCLFLMHVNPQSVTMKKII